MIVHIAGVTITVHGTHQRQRCSWCGAILQDYDLTRVMVQTPPDGSEPDGPPSWQVGAQVAHDGAAWWVENDEDTEKLAEASCARLPPEMTLRDEEWEI